MIKNKVDAMIVIAEQQEQITQLEADLTKEIESRDGWRDAWKKSEAENEQLREALHQEGHVIIFTEDGWSIQHPIECRPDMTSCEIHQFMNEHASFPVEGFGKYKVGLSEGTIWFEALGGE